MIIEKKDNSLYFHKNIKSLVWFQLYWLMFYGVLRDLVGVPGYVAYMLDLFNIILIAYVIFNGKMIKYRNSRVGLWIILSFFCSTVIGLIAVDGSPILYIWGFRNVFRYYAYFISCTVLLDISDVLEIIPKLKKIYIINFFICLVEFGLGYSGDNIGGIFGTQSGCNGYLNLFLIVVSAIYVTEYLEKKIGLMRIMLAIVSCFFLMAIAELKVYLFELPIIILIGMINAKFSFRKIIIIMFGVCGIAIGISMLGHFFESSGLDFFTSDAISKYMGDSGYTNTGDLSRMNAVSQLYERFLQGNFWKSVFGIGLGNASYSAAFSFFNSRFYLLYQALHYQWFTDAIVFIETGTVGLVLYELFFLRVFTYSRKINKRIASEYSGEFSQQLRCVVQVAGITAVLCVVNSVYNSALNMDAGYMVYFIFAIPAIVDVFMKGNVCYDK